jgi:hypothetical protein
MTLIMFFDIHSIVLSVVRIHFFFSHFSSIYFRIFRRCCPSHTSQGPPVASRWPRDQPILAVYGEVLRPALHAHTAQCVVYIVEPIVEGIVPLGGSPSHSTPPVTTGIPGHRSKRSQMHSPEDKLKGSKPYQPSHVTRNGIDVVRHALQHGRAGHAIVHIPSPTPRARTCDGTRWDQ